MGARVVLFGATGYTGRLTAERLVARGVKPVLAGRDPERLKRLAEHLGEDLETVHADVFRQNSVFSLVEEGDVLVSLVGPFVRYGEVAVRAAIAAGATYLDSTGEGVFIRRVFDEFDAPAEKSGAKLVTAMGYDFAPGSLAGALALKEAGQDAVRVDIGYYSVGNRGPGIGSEGTNVSSVGIMLDPSFAFRGGRVVEVRPAERVRAFEVDGREQPAFSIGGSEHFGLPAAFPQLLEVNVYLGWFGPLSRAVQAGSLATSVVTKLPGARSALQFAGERLVSFVPSRTEDSPRDSVSMIAAVAHASDGTPLAEVHLRGTDAYEFTAGMLAWGAARAASAGVSGTGALGPVEAFGLAELERGCAEAGISRAA